MKKTIELLFKKYTCCHIWKGLRKNTNLITKCTSPKLPIGYTEITYNSQFYDIEVITEILVCEKCGKLQKIEY